MDAKVKEASKCYPYNVSDMGLRDADSNMRLYRGMSSPWGAIKNFYETYKFESRLGAEFCVAAFHALRVAIPDYDRRQTLLSDNWGGFMDMCWSPMAGQIGPFEDRFDIPPFLKDGEIRAAVYADKGDTIASCREQHEIIRSKDDAAIEAALEKAAPAFGGKKIDEFDVMAYTLATEAGFYLITDLDEATPFETGIDWTIDWSKEDFLGKAAAEKAKALPKFQELVGITVDKAFTKVHGGPYGGCVSNDGKEIGRVTKFTYGFTAGKWVGFALVKAGTVQPGDHVTVDWDVDAVVTAERRFINT